MKLKKTWMGVCVGVIYVLGMIFAIGVTGFVSGLFPSYDRYLVAGVTVIACALAALVVSWLLGLIGDKVNDLESVNNFEKPVWLEILIVIAIVIAGFVVYNQTAMLTIEYSGNITLYDKALVAVSDLDTQSLDIADRAYVTLLRCVMSFVGNSLMGVYILNAALRILMVVFIYIAIRLSMGMIAAITSSAALLAIPVFGYSLHTISSENVIFTLVGLELMLVVMYVMGFERKIGSRWIYKLISIVVGAYVGLMIYFEAGSCAVIVFLIAAWMLADLQGDTFNVCINEMLLLLAGVASFIGMLVYEGGTGNVPDTYYKWTWKFYGFNVSEWLKMIDDSIPNTYFALGLLAAALIPAFLTLIRDRCEKITPWLAFAVLGTALSVFLGETANNSEVFIICSIVLIISCGAACTAYNDIVEDIKEESEFEEDDDSEDEENSEETDTSEENDTETAAGDKTDEDATSGNKADEDATSGNKADEDATSGDKTAEVATSGNKIDENVASDSNAAENTSVEKKEIKETNENKNSEKEPAPRFVPEGMVLPTGDEDEENLVPNFNMNRPEMADIGVLSIGNKKTEDNSDEKVDEKAEDKSGENIEEKTEKKTEEKAQEKLQETEILKAEAKDDFDISIKPGDDFDI